jgi:exodeoxyribonuclease V alpha subunit
MTLHIAWQGDRRMTRPMDKEIAEVNFSEIDRHFADFMVELAGGIPPHSGENLWLASALVSRYVGRGHVCLNLPEVAGMALAADDEGEIPSAVFPGIDEWVGDLRGLLVVGQPGDFKPLVLDEKFRLYLYRYWLYEQQLARFILDRAQRHPREVDKELLAEGLKRLFPGNGGEKINWQGVAAAVAVFNQFTVISGGPGTGKTHTVARILALLIEQAKGAGSAIALAAPTGKAAARLTDMVSTIKAELDCPLEVKALIPDKAFTIHRLLGPVYGAKTFRYNASNRLPYDVIVIDEASMIDLPLMAKLATSLKENCRLILLGDKDQLASVEPGAVFGDICDTGSVNTFSVGLTSAVEDLISSGLPHQGAQGSVLADSIVVLQKSYRFGPESGIGLLASAVKEFNSSEAFMLLKGANQDDIIWREAPPGESLDNAIEENFFAFYSDYLTSQSPEEAFSLFNRFHLLCALRHGPYGVIALNRKIEQMCRRRGLIEKAGRWYKCQPVMVTSNDYQLKLFNGDVGILFPDQDAGGQLRVYFPAADGGFRKLLPGRLKNYETVYAMTVHKSQGSEFDNVMVLLPDRPSKVVTRELVYTAITRAKKSVEIWGSEQALREALSRTFCRESGLRDMLSKS